MHKDEPKAEATGWRQHLLLSLAVGLGIPLITALLNPWLALVTMLVALAMAGLYGNARRQHPERKLNWLMFLAIITEMECIAIGTHWEFSDQSYIMVIFITLGIIGPLAIPLNLYAQTRSSSTLRWPGVAVTLMVILTVISAFLYINFEHTGWGSSLWSLTSAMYTLIAIILIVMLRRYMGN